MSAPVEQPGLKSVLPVISQHADEASFLWTLRSRGAKAPNYGLPDLAKMDCRVEAHLDGLRIARDKGWKICEKQLAANEKGEVFVAAVLAFESCDRQRIEQVLKVRTAEPNEAGGLVSALGWLPPERAEGYARALTTHESAWLRRVGLAAFAVHRRNPGEALRAAFRDQDPTLQARALRAFGELGRTDLIQDASQAVSSENPEVRFWASWSVALLSGSASALSLLKSLTEGPSLRKAEAVQMVMQRWPLSEAKAWQKKLTQRPEHLRLAISGAGHLGEPEAIPWLIERMGQLPLARLAGEAFTMITGVDLAYRDLERKPPEDFNAGPTEDPKDENVEMDPDDNLPWPEPALVQKWWDKNRGQFQNGTRYLLGKPMNTEWLKTVLRDGRQRQRAAAALELAIRQPGTPMFNVKAPGFRQIELLGKPGPAIR
jgi:uncharacterized protein (TIGR02270 family)